MQNVVRKFIQQTGNDVVEPGSWIRGGQYRDVLTAGNAVTASDHDLSLLVPPGVGPEEASLRWKNSRQQFIRLINEEFGQETPAESSEVVMEPTSKPLTPASTTPETPTSIELPSDPDSAIIVLDAVGGYTPPRKSKEPELVIYANGRAVITDPFGRYPEVIHPLTPENLKAFPEIVVNEHHYCDLTTEGLGALIEHMKAQGAVPEITHMPAAIIRIGSRNMTYEVRCPSPNYFATQFPETDPFRHYGAIYKRLTSFIAASRE